MSLEIESLADQHILERFDSGAPELDRWLALAARQSQNLDVARVFVIAAPDRRVVAYSALVVSTLQSGLLSSRARSGLPENIPAVLLGKLAVDHHARAAGLGSRLLGHAARQALEVRARVGVRLLVAESRDDSAREWYVDKGMAVLSDGRTCYVRLKDLGRVSQVISAT